MCQYYFYFTSHNCLALHASRKDFLGIGDLFFHVFHVCADQSPFLRLETPLIPEELFCGIRLFKFDF